jgi:5'-phosphate synthase pdxT subunit
VILLARQLGHDSGSIKVQPLGLLDAVADRNAYGRQVDSFEAELEVDWPALGLPGEQGTFHGVFIRAPQLIAPGPALKPVAAHNGVLALARQDNILAATFHPELTDDLRLHQAVLAFGA